MAFNPNSYEHIYGFDLFDTIHNFFPEIMYDDNMFTGELENWIRYRISGFFPAMYSRQQNTYRIFRANAINESYNSWRAGNLPNIVVPNIPSQPTQVRFSPRQTQFPSRIVRSYGQRSPQQESRNLEERGSRPMREPTRFNRTIRTNPENLIIPLLTTSLIIDEAHRMWANDFADVNVPATQDQITSASEIRENAAVPPETVCAICQDHDIQTEQNTWRALRCSHLFHKTCIDNWFRQNVHCPVCRTDIREYSAERVP